MEYTSVFEIIGPIMVGPSSSHTAGAVRIGKIAHTLYGGVPERVDVLFFGSFARTHKGHATDSAIVAGILGMEPEDENIPHSLRLAGERGLIAHFDVSGETGMHPNSVRLHLSGEKGELDLVGCSTGGGAIEISQLDSFPMHWSAQPNSLLVFHKDVFGVIADVTRILADYQINIGSLHMSRQQRGARALMLIDTDGRPPKDALGRIAALPNVHRYIFLE